MSKWKKQNKTSSVLKHLEEFGSITSWEAIKEYGATRLSAIIYRLRNDYDLNIETHLVSFIDRYGTPSDYAKYVLVKDDNYEK